MVAIEPCTVPSVLPLSSKPFCEVQPSPFCVDFTIEPVQVHNAQNTNIGFLTFFTFVIRKASLIYYKYPFLIY